MHFFHMQHPFSYPLIVLVWCRSPYILLPRLYFRNARSVSLLPGHSNRQIKEKEKKLLKPRRKFIGIYQEWGEQEE